SSKMTYGEAIDKYISINYHILSPSTVRGYKKIQSNYLQKIINTPISALNTPKIQAAINEDASTLSAKTVSNSVGLLKTVLKLFMPEYSPVVKLPQREYKETIVPEDEDIKLLLTESKKLKSPNLYKALLLASCVGGMRRSEVAALTYDDIDSVNNTITINKAIVENENKKLIQKAPKTTSSNRTVKVSPLIIEELLRYKESDNVFTCTINGISGRYNRLKAKHNINIKFHDLRHYNASVMHSLNVPNKYAMGITGHSTESTLTGVYQHKMKNKVNEIDQQLSDYYTKIIQSIE
ncbi:MAG: site-specific integrase, partial [Clostridiales bacterium]|nr:site-specific integrase [Clostridiales bacterium]